MILRPLSCTHLIISLYNMELGEENLKCWPPVPPKMKPQHLMGRFGGKEPYLLDHTHSDQNFCHAEVGGFGRSVLVQVPQTRTVLTEIQPIFLNKCFVVCYMFFGKIPQTLNSCLFKISFTNYGCLLGIRSMKFLPQTTILEIVPMSTFLTTGKMWFTIFLM